MRAGGPRIVLTLLAIGALATACRLADAAPEPSRSPRAAAPASPSEAASDINPDIGIYNLDHIIFVVQENRSFDHYFGTFPGAEGIPRNRQGEFTVCVPDPRARRCYPPYHDTNLFDQGGPHDEKASDTSVDGGKMDGFIEALQNQGNGCDRAKRSKLCDRANRGPQGQPDVMGYHTAAEIPNYWAYAKTYTLQDHMFAPADSWTLPAHLYLVSAWAAVCPDLSDAMSCRSNLSFSKPRWKPSDGAPRPYIWADITWLLNRRNVSWAYYVGPGTCVKPPCKEKAGVETVPVQNPLPGFKTVQVTRSFKRIKPNTKYFEAAAEGRLPSVSWVMPTIGNSEHPPDDIAPGMAWVTKVVNAVMEGPEEQWMHTAIFITWDDWGGFYDHVKPIRIDPNGYGIRVPGIMISPWSKPGSIDPQTLSFDAYLKLIEDRFLASHRIDPRTDKWPDSRPNVRENAPELGDLSLEFDFSQDPIPPLILDPNPR